MTGMAVVAAGAVALFLGAAALSSAQTVYVEVGPIKTSFSASIKPRALPKSTRAPIAVRLSSTVVAKGGGQIPAQSGSNLHHWNSASYQ